MKPVTLVACLLAAAMWCALPARALAGPVDIPVNIGLGPAWFLPGPASVYPAGMLVHYTGVKLDIAAVIDQELIRRNRDRVPQQYRQLVDQVGEARVGSLYVPESIVLAQGPTASMVGATWGLLGLNLPLTTGPVKVQLHGKLIVTAAQMTMPSSQDPGAGSVATTFLRPGVNLGASVELPLHPRFLVKAGWDEALYVPQKVGGGIGELGSGTDSVWLFGEPYVMAELRIPFRVDL